MKKSLLLAVSIVITMTGLAVAQDSKKIITEYDRFENSTSVTAAIIVVVNGRALALLPTFSYSGRQLTQSPDIIRMIVSAPADNWTSTSNPPFKVLVNESRFEFSRDIEIHYINSARLGDVLMQNYGIRVPIGDFQSLACAKSLSVKFGMMETDLQLADIERLRAVLQAAGRQCPGS